MKKLVSIFFAIMAIFTAGCSTASGGRNSMDDTKLQLNAHGDALTKLGVKTEIDLRAESSYAQSVIPVNTGLTFCRRASCRAITC